MEIHPHDAERLHLASGDHVKVRGPRAEIESRVVVTHSINQGVIAVPVGFGHEAMGAVASGKGANPLTLPFTDIDANSGAPAWGPIPVFLQKS